jgi:20S proteasome subunit beta 2
MEVTDRLHPQDTIAAELNELAHGGFSFDNVIRNDLIMNKLNDSKMNSVLPKAWKTGTTIVGVVYKDGVVLGADTRATGGAEVMDKNCEKIHYLAPNIWCCGAGTAADTEKTTELIASNLELLRLSAGTYLLVYCYLYCHYYLLIIHLGTQSRVVTALTLLKRMLFRYQGHVSAALVLGGVDIHGPHLYCIHPHGSTQRQAYTTMGSGSLAAMAVFEARYKEDMEEAAAIEIVRDAIRAGIFNDLGSGSNVDITVIRKDQTVSRHRTYENAAGSADSYRAKYVRPNILNIPKGTTYIVEETFKPRKNKNITLISAPTAVTSGGASTAMEL